MTLKIAIELDESQQEFAEKLVKDGIYPSISSVVQAGLHQMMRNEEVSADAPSPMAEEIRRRLELPKDQWLPWIVTAFWVVSGPGSKKSTTDSGR